MSHYIIIIFNNKSILLPLVTEVEIYTNHASYNIYYMFSLPNLIKITFIGKKCEEYI